MLSLVLTIALAAVEGASCQPTPPSAGILPGEHPTEVSPIPKPKEKP